MRFDNLLRRALACALGALALLVCSSSLLRAETLQAQQLATFQPQPASAKQPEFVWSGSELYEGSGAVGTGFLAHAAGDGEKLVSQQLAPGLEFVSPFLISGVPGGVTNAAANSTTFYDATLDILPTGNAVNGMAAVGAPEIVGGSFFLQGLGAAGFDLWSTNPIASPHDPALLLSGTINSAYLSGILNSSTGSLISDDVTYTGGAILQALGATRLSGSFSWSMLNVTKRFHLTSGHLASFQANGTGQFSAQVPEPGTVIMLVFGAAGLAGYAWLRRHGWAARRAKAMVILSCLIGCLAFASPSRAETLQGEQIATFQPEPFSSNVYEFVWNGSELYVGPGAVGTGFLAHSSGDGELPVDQQSAPGLAVVAPFVINGLPGGVTNSSSMSTTFYDATLEILPLGTALKGLPAIGAPVQIGQSFVQALGSADFNIWSTDPVASPHDPTLLLSGKINSAFLSGILNADTGGVVSAEVSYTGGAILDALGPEKNTGELSWSLLDVLPKFHFTGGQLDPFQANGVGEFSAVPEPGAFVLLAMAAAAFAGWFWCKRRAA